MSNPRWSYSRFSTFKSCKNKYKLQYLDQFVVIGREVDVADKGLSIHQIAEQLNSEMTFEQLMDIAKKDLETRSFDQEKFPVIKAIPRLWEWYQEFIVPFEKSGFRLYKESWERGIIEEQNFVGALDTLLIKEETNDIRIYDFKTAKTANASTYKSQLYLYTYLIAKRLGIEDFSNKIKLFVFFPLSDLKDEEVSDKEFAKKQAMKMMKQIVFTNEDILSNIEDIRSSIIEDSKTDWANSDPRELAQMSYSCSWCGFCGNKTYCPLSYESGLRFPRKASVLTKESADKLKNG